MEPDLLSDHFALSLTLSMGKREMNNQRKRLYLAREKTQHFIAAIELWYRNYQPTSANEFYDDLVKEIERILTPKKKSRKPRNSNKNKYSHDKMLRGWTAMLRTAHRKWEDAGRDEESRGVLLEAARLCGEARKEARGEYWTRFTNDIGNTKGISEIWRKVRQAQGKQNNTVTHPNPQGFASELMDKWASAAKADLIPEEIQASLAEWEEHRRETINMALNTGNITDVDITKDELLRAIKYGKSTAPGEDGVTYDILNCLASIDEGPLLHLFNLSFREGRLPRAWRKAIIIPIAKPGGGGYRPVSLTSCFCKMMERIMLERLTYIIGDNLSNNLYGFMKGKGTTDAVIKCLSHDSDYCRTFIDLKGAFDKTNSEVIMYELTKLGVSGRMLYWIGDYLQGRRAQVFFQGALSEERGLDLGTPQGGVLSPMLFNVLMNKIARQKLADDVNVIIYADDIMLQGKTVEGMQRALNVFGVMSKQMGLIINEDKTKFQCRSVGQKILTINDKAIDSAKLQVPGNVYGVKLR